MHRHIPIVKEAAGEAGFNLWRLVRVAAVVIAAWMLLPYLLKVIF